MIAVEVPSIRPERRPATRSRIVTLVLITLLALPMTAAMPPVQASLQLHEQAGTLLVAKKKSKKKGEGRH